MKTDKPSLAKALPHEMGALLHFQVTRAERFKLNGHVRKYGATESRLRDGEKELVSALWSRGVGIALPAAVTVQFQNGEARSILVTGLELYYCKFDYDWHVTLSGLNIRQTGATGNTREGIHLQLRLPFAMAKRDLAGSWLPVAAPGPAEVTC